MANSKPPMVVIHASFHPPLASGSSSVCAGDARTEQRRASELHHTTGGVHKHKASCSAHFNHTPRLSSTPLKTSKHRGLEMHTTSNSPEKRRHFFNICRLYRLGNISADILQSRFSWACINLPLTSERFRNSVVADKMEHPTVQSSCSVWSLRPLDGNPNICSSLGVRFLWE